MSNIQPGDVVVCVKLAKRGPVSRGLDGNSFFSVGKMYRVCDTVFHLGKLGLCFPGLPSCHPTRAWNAEFFRKLRPADPEFIAQIKRMKEPV